MFYYLKLCNSSAKFKHKSKLRITALNK